MQNRIREIRKQRGLTMKQLGAIIGVAESTVSQYETGKRQPDNEALLKLGKYFSVSIEYLLGAEAEKAPTENKKSPTPEGVELIPGYSDLNEANKTKVREYIALLAMSEHKD